MTWTPHPLNEGLGYRPPALGQVPPNSTRKGGAPTDARMRPAYRVPRIQPRTPLRSRVLSVSGDTDTQAIEKVRLLGAHVVKPALDPTKAPGLSFTRRLLGEALQGAPSKANGHHKGAEAVRIFEWVRSRIRYVNDPVGVELFTAVGEAFRRGLGDCDDFTAILASLFLAAGIPARARIIQVKGTPGWSHIYPVALLDGAWRAFDATQEVWAGRRVRAGWEFPEAARTLDVELV